MSFSGVARYAGHVRFFIVPMQSVGTMKITPLSQDTMTRQIWVLLHRYASLATAGFLILIGLTGSLLAFQKEQSRVIYLDAIPYFAGGLIGTGYHWFIL
jgi:hypothetical protein